MALGTNKTQIRSLDYIKRNLADHAEMVLALEASGVSSKQASKISFDEITRPKKAKKNAAV